MTDGAKTLIKWLNSNVLTSYQEPVSSSASLPYISLNYTEAPTNESSSQSLTIWTRNDSSYSEAYGYADKLSRLLGDQGVIITNEDTKLYVSKGTPFVQNRLDDTETIRAVLVNVVVTNLNI
jgi:hypothetical protein